MKNPFSSRENGNSEEQSQGRQSFGSANASAQSAQPHSSSLFDDSDYASGNIRYNNPFSSSNDDDGSGTVIDTLTGYPKVVAPAAKSMTVISSDAQITGDLRSQGDLNMMGIINGNIEIQGNMNASGSITGNIVAGSAHVSAGRIEGDFFNSEGNVKVEESAELLCNLATGSLETSGKITGDIEAEKGVIINESASVNGNITAKYITIKEGARINGNLKIGDI